MTDPPLKGWDRLRELVSRFAAQKPDGSYSDIIGAEVGVSMGWTSEKLLATFFRLHLFMVDFWDAAPEDSDYAKSGDGHAHLTALQQRVHRDTATKRTEFAADRRTILAMDSVEAAQMILDETLSFCFVDGDHTYSGVKRDLEAWWPKVKGRGLLIMHDVDHPRDRRGLWGVRRAVEEFATNRILNLTVDTAATIAWFVKC